MTIKTQLIEHRVSGEKLLAKVREVIHQGNVRRIIIQNHDGTTVMELPLTIGVAGAVLLPVWVAVGAIAALAADYRIAVERVHEEDVPGAKAAPEAMAEPAATAVGEPW
jgi:hypothetical protein